MALKDMLGIFRKSKVDPRSQMMREKNKAERKASKLQGRESRLMRDAQSAIRKDIKAVERDIKRTPPGERRDNLQAYRDRLVSIRDSMRASNKVDGETVYNRRSSRLEAMTDYLMNYKGRLGRATYSESRVERVPPYGNNLFERMGGKQAIDRMVGDAWSPMLDDLIEEVYEAMRSYRYEDMVDAWGRLNAHARMLRSMYETVPRGSTDYDSY